MEIVSRQLKQPQVHVGDGVEGAAGQQHHFSLLLGIFRGHFLQLRSSVQNPGACHQPLHEEMRLKNSYSYLFVLTISRRFQDQIERYFPSANIWPVIVHDPIFKRLTFWGKRCDLHI